MMTTRQEISIAGPGSRGTATVPAYASTLTALSIKDGGLRDNGAAVGHNNSEFTKLYREKFYSGFSLGSVAISRTCKMLKSNTLMEMSTLD